MRLCQTLWNLANIHGNCLQTALNTGAHCKQTIPQTREVLGEQRHHSCWYPTPGSTHPAGQEKSHTETIDQAETSPTSDICCNWVKNVRQEFLSIPAQTCMLLQLPPGKSVVIFFWHKWAYTQVKIVNFRRYLDYTMYLHLSLFRHTFLQFFFY